MKKLISKIKELNEWQKFIIEAAFIIIFGSIFFTKVIINGYVPSESMEPTLMTGDISISYALAYAKKAPTRGDIIIFSSEEQTHGDMYIKRVIGLPGDNIKFVDGDVYINEELLVEEYIPTDIHTTCWRSIERVPEGTYFVMGDNREVSMDSRDWDNPFVAMDDIRGKMIAKLSRAKIRKLFQREHMRKHYEHVRKVQCGHDASTFAYAKKKRGEAANFFEKISNNKESNHKE